MTATALLSAIEERMAEPTARSLASAVGSVIREGHIAEGDKLPPIRSVAMQLGISPTTVSAAWAILQRAGMIATRGRDGTRIAPRQFGPRRYRSALTRGGADVFRADGTIVADRASGADGNIGADGTGITGARPHFAVDLSTGTPDPALLPSVAASLKRIRPPAEPCSYLDEPVLAELAEILYRTWPFAAQQITVVDGAMDALQLIAATHLRLGDLVAVEDPCFPPLLDLLESVGAVPVPVRLDASGPRPDDVRSSVDRGARALVIQPRGQNPTGISMTATRMNELAEILYGADILVIEDDSLGSIATADDISLGNRLPERTLHVRSYSKSHGPDLRLAALGGPLSLMVPIIDRRFLGQGWTSRLLQRVLTDLLTDQSAIAAVDNARREYARRRDTLVKECAHHGIDVVGGDGLNIWVPVADETAAMLLLATEGIGASSGRPFMVNPDQQPHLRITTGLVQDDFARLANVIAYAAGAHQLARGR
ncbi:MAG: aminotransferase class I/II-fold pyridoxal phosphate-dependent enzyme [Nakamurella sp.]